MGAWITNGLRWGECPRCGADEAIIIVDTGLCEDCHRAVKTAEYEAQRATEEEKGRRQTRILLAIVAVLVGAWLWDWWNTPPIEPPDDAVPECPLVGPLAC